jgi:hypothetical protein
VARRSDDQPERGIEEGKAEDADDGKVFAGIRVFARDCCTLSLAYVTKPLMPEDLLVHMQTALNRRVRAHASPDPLKRKSSPYPVTQRHAELAGLRIRPLW